MPDDQGNPTEQDLVHELGWDDGDVELDEPVEVTPAAPPVAQVPPVDTPAGAPAPGTPPAAPATPNYEQLYSQQMQDAQRQANETQVRDGINNRAGQYRNQLVVSGQMDEAGANEAARQFATAEWHKHQFERSEQENESRARTEYANQVANRYGVPVDEVINAATPQAMEMAGARAANSNTRIANLEAQVKTGLLAPVQNYDSNQGGGGQSNAQRKMDYALGNIDLTSEEFRQLYG